MGVFVRGKKTRGRQEEDGGRQEEDGEDGGRCKIGGEDIFNF
uniref:Uncharacterized protein n=1 Tax=viral metagenome TaxID=1070528 RepID=A0A6C0DNI3_9ZZZZ